ncbi:MAG: efflux RND transporter periplasmic adaptor subunit [Synergistaceae bacterium]|nr:efflux RND transporter periplasmic adaptor subunit [Synergistaceae bacterium]
MENDNRTTEIQNESQNTENKKYIAYIIVAVIIAAAAGGWWYFKKEEEKKAAAAAAAVVQPPVVSAMVVKRSDVPVEMEYTGQTSGFREAELRAQVGGIIKKKSYKEGMPVKAGQVMFTIDPAPYRAVLNRNTASLKQSEVQMNQMKIDFDRAAALYKKNAISKAEYDAAQSGWQASKAAVDAAKALVRQAQIDLGWTTVRAPISGYSGKEQYSVGNLIEAGGLLTTIIQSDKLYVDFAIPADSYRRNEQFKKQGYLKVRPEGLSVELALGDGTKIEKRGKIDFQNRFVTPETASIKARAVFDNKDNELYSGQFVRVYVKGYYVPNILQVPLKAVVQASSQSFVYRLDEKNIPEKTEIRIILTIGNNCLVASGVKEGDRIVLDGVGKVRPGEEVAVEGEK